MDDPRFDDFARTLVTTPSRRGVLAGLVTALLACLPLALVGEKVAGKKRKRKRKKKKKRSHCTPQCDGKTCGPNGCGGTCGTCDADRACQAGTCECIAGHAACVDICCGECQVCDSDICIMEPGSDDQPCGGGTCYGGACCPPSCQRGVTGPYEPYAEYIADFLDQPFPFCSAAGTGQPCTPGGSDCPADTECHSFNTGVGTFSVCAGACPGANYPDGP
jgi:hypothetical protein